MKPREPLKSGVELVGGMKIFGGTPQQIAAISRRDSFIRQYAEEKEGLSDAEVYHRKDKNADAEGKPAQFKLMFGKPLRTVLPISQMSTLAVQEWRNKWSL